MSRGGPFSTAGRPPTSGLGLTSLIIQKPRAQAVWFLPQRALQATQTIHARTCRTCSDLLNAQHSHGAAGANASGGTEPPTRRRGAGRPRRTAKRCGFERQRRGEFRQRRTVKGYGFERQRQRDNPRWAGRFSLPCASDDRIGGQTAPSAEPTAPYGGQTTVGGQNDRWWSDDCWWSNVVVKRLLVVKRPLVVKHS